MLRHFIVVAILVASGCADAPSVRPQPQAPSGQRRHLTLRFIDQHRQEIKGMRLQVRYSLEDPVAGCSVHGSVIIDAGRLDIELPSECRDKLRLELETFPEVCCFRHDYFIQREAWVQVALDVTIESFYDWTKLAGAQ